MKKRIYTHPEAEIIRVSNEGFSVMSGGSGVFEEEKPGNGGDL